MDGVTWSNTRWLAQAAGWKSMLIEACPSELGSDNMCVVSSVG